MPRKRQVKLTRPIEQINNNIDAAIEKRTGPLNRPAYETTGDSPARTVTQRVNAGLTAMFSEIAPNLFVGWDMCSACTKHVGQCRCLGGPKEAAYIARWREERDGATPTPSPVDEALSAAVEAVQERSVDQIDVGF